ncbi:unnamed protein product [Cyclocybe aegerita]|uniref:Uncharacterized protein n=1 Tax=Cyclocybe aegerita TaxID=1973307 RepID=A0A8S0WR71_CYCAE|nr:unnamed protein product [Cyclocybe aegerita]
MSDSTKRTPLKHEDLLRPDDSVAPAAKKPKVAVPQDLEASPPSAASASSVHRQFAKMLPTMRIPLGGRRDSHRASDWKSSLQGLPSRFVKDPAGFRDSNSPMSRLRARGIEKLIIIEPHIVEKPSSLATQCVEPSQEYKLPNGLIKLAYYDLASTPP